MRRIVASALTVLAVVALAPTAQARPHRSTLDHVQIPLAFEDGGDGTGYASFPVPFDLRLVRVRVVVNAPIDTITVYDSAGASPAPWEDRIAYVLETTSVTDDTVRFSPVYGVQRGRFLDVTVCTVPPGATSGYVRITYEI